MTWVFKSDDVGSDLRYAELGWAGSWICGVVAEAFCRRNEARRAARGERLDVLPDAAVLTLFGDPEARQHLEAAVRVGLWERVEGGYLILDYMAVYHSGASQQSQQAAPAAGQQPASKGLSEAQLAARRLGGQKRAETSSRLAGRYQQRPAADQQNPTSKAPAAPASRASDSGAGSDSGSQISTVNAAPKDLSGNARGDDDGAAAMLISCPPDLSISDQQRDALDAAGIPREFIDATTVVFLASKAPGQQRTRETWLSWLASYVCGKWTDERAKPPHLAKPAGRVVHEMQQRAASAPDADFPTPRDELLRIAILAGEHGQEILDELRAGRLDASLARRMVHDREQRRSEYELQRAGGDG